MKNEEEKKPNQFIPIAFEGRLTEEDRKMLYELRGTVPFNLLRKLMAEQYAMISMTLMSLAPEDLRLAQGQLLGISGIYNLLHTLGKPEEKTEAPLPFHKKLLHNKV